MCASTLGNKTLSDSDIILVINIINDMSTEQISTNWSLTRGQLLALLFYSSFDAESVQEMNTLFSSDIVGQPYDKITLWSSGK